MFKWESFLKSKDNSTHKSINVQHHINRIKDKNQKVILVDARKSTNTIQHPLIIKHSTNCVQNDVLQHNISDV